MDISSLINLVKFLLNIGLNIVDIIIISINAYLFYLLKKEIKNLYHTKANKDDLFKIKDSIEKRIDDGFKGVAARINDVYTAIQLINNK